MNPEIQILLARKAKADSLPPEIRQKYLEEYQNIVLELAKHAVVHSLPAWDEDVNSVILTVLFWQMGKKYDHKKPYIEWMCQSLVPEADAGFQTRDQDRFYRCVSLAVQQLGNV